MTTEEIEVIINSDIPSYQKSRLLEQLFNKKNEDVKVCKEGGTTEVGSTPEPDEEIMIGDKRYQVCIADTEKERRIGLSKCKHLPKDGGMLFVFDKPVREYFTMKETSIDLDIIFIDEEGVVISVESVKAHSEDPVVCEREYQYVLEVNINSGIQVGDELDQEDIDFTDEEKEQVKKSKMLVLNSEGDVQMKLVGGERIVSMIKTRQLIKAALKAYKTDNDADYRRVGRIIMKEFDQLDQRDPQYVEKN